MRIKDFGKMKLKCLTLNYQASKKLVFQLIVKVKLINDDEKISAGRARTEQFVSVDKTIRLACPAPTLRTFVIL